MAITYDDIAPLMDTVDANRAEVAICLLGNPGVGKTSAVEQWAKLNGRNVFHYYLAQANPTEITGITMPDQETGTMVTMDHEKLRSMKSGDVMFLDEFLQAPPQVMSSALTMVQERRLASGYELPDVVIVACSNPTNAAMQVPMNVRQRFMFAEVKFNEGQWAKYMCLKYGLLQQDACKLASCCVDKPDSEEWNMPSPRTIEKLFLMVKAAHGNQKVIDSIVRSTNLPTPTRYCASIFDNLGKQKEEFERAKSMMREIRERSDGHVAFAVNDDGEINLEYSKEYKVAQKDDLPDVTVSELVRMLSEDSLFIEKFSRVLEEMEVPECLES